LQVIHLSHSDNTGGASKAAYRIHSSLLECGIDSRLGVNLKTLSDPSVFTPYQFRAIPRLRNHLVKPLRFLHRDPNHDYISPSILPSRWPRYIRTVNPHLVHLHWVQGEMLSVRDIASFACPVVWSLHDMWPFCGAEHNNFSNDRWIRGYLPSNKPHSQSGIDLNQWTWERKRTHFTKPITLVSPSLWLARQASLSLLMHSWHVEVIPHPLDFSFWHPVNRATTRLKLGLPSNQHLILFAGLHLGESKTKGVDLFYELLDHLDANYSVVLLGDLTHHPRLSSHPNVISIGSISNSESMRDYYSACDLTLVTSRQESFGLVAAESLACGTPVVAFNVGALPERITHMKTGYLAQPFDLADLIQGIKTLTISTDASATSTLCRSSIRHTLSYEAVSHRLLQLYHKLLHSDNQPTTFHT